MHRHFAMYSNHKCMAIYKPLSNVFFNHKFSESRSKYGMHLISMKQTKKSFEEKIQSQEQLYLVRIRIHANPKRAHWVQFLNQDTAVLFGVEKYSKEYDWPVVFVSISKVKRGHYEVEYS